MRVHLIDGFVLRDFKVSLLLADGLAQTNHSRVHEIHRIFFVPITIRLYTPSIGSPHST